MHSILDIAKDINQDIVIIDLTQLVDAQDLDDRITDCKSKNKFVLLYVLDNYQNNSHGHSSKYADYVERVRNQYDNFAYVTPGRHSDNKHISCVDNLTMFSCDSAQPVCDHDREKLYDFLLLVGKPHQHRIDLLIALAEKKLLQKTLLSFQNPNNIYSHVLPGTTHLPSKYEWPEFTNVGGFKYYQADNKHSDIFQRQQGKVLPLLYEDTACSIVTETNIDNDIVYLTEKTWTPIVAEHFLVIQSNYGTLDFLTSLGFDFDYGLPYYDNNDHNQIASVCQDISKKSMKELYAMSENKRRYNRNLALNEGHWIGYHKQQLKHFGGPFV
tara:strand:- start:45 stop:1025 length:981 start_codon:yes stop_codon:yes gene_type:complete